MPRTLKKLTNIKIRDTRKLGQKLHQNDKNDEKMMKFSSQRCKSDEDIRDSDILKRKVLTRRALPRKVIYRTWEEWPS